MKLDLIRPVAPADLTPGRRYDDTVDRFTFTVRAVRRRGVMVAVDTVEHGTVTYGGLYRGIYPALPGRAS